MNKQESNVNKGFSLIYNQYDELDKSGIVVKWMRQRVHKHILKFIKPKASVLELNSGSGLDAIFLAKRGHQVLATDISDGFLKFTTEKIKNEKLESLIDLKQMSFTEIGNVNQKFDFIFSNFGGLNCIGDVDSVLKQFKEISNPDAIISLVVLPKYTPWEWLWFYKGFQNAFRRLQKPPIKANIEGHQIDVWYHSPKTILKTLKSDFKLLKIENIGFFTPTGANDDFPLKFPRIFKWLIWIDEKLNFMLPKGVGDYYIITLKKK